MMKKAFMFSFFFFVVIVNANKVNISCPTYFKDGRMNEIICVYNKDEFLKESCLFKHINPVFDVTLASGSTWTIICHSTAQLDPLGMCWCVESSSRIFTCTLWLNGSMVQEGGRVVFKHCRSGMTSQTDEDSPSCNITIYNVTEPPPEHTDSDHTGAIVWSIVGSGVTIFIIVFIVFVVRAVRTPGMRNQAPHGCLPVTISRVSGSLQN